MPADLPDLDDRTFDQIRGELLLRIPRYTPEWTDWNESDPGITLVEIFAWLAESIGYRLNRAPERCLLTFLEALGITPEPARPATTDLTFTVRQGTTRPIQIPALTVVQSSVQTDQGPIVFETERGLQLMPLRLQSLQLATLGSLTATTVEDGPVPDFSPFGADPQVGNACYLGFGPADVPVQFPQELTFLVDPEAGSASAPSSARLQWEYRTSATGDRWSALATYEDGSRSFTRRGYVRIAGPRNSVPLPQLGKEERPMHWLRCRLAGGGYPGTAPRIGLRYNTVEAVSLSSVDNELLGLTSGRTGQVVRLAHGSVLPAKVTVRTEPPPDQAATQPAETWTRVRDLAESGPDDRHFTVDAITGELRFGDGQHGQVPLAGCEIRADYRYGGSRLANVPRDSVTTLLTVPPGVESVTNLRQAQGGADEETNLELRRNAASRLRGDERAVTVEDYRRLARAVGGVADATAVAQAHPDYRGVALPGCVTVAVLADVEGGQPAGPELLDAVEDALRDARSVGTELFVRSVRLVQVMVDVLVEVDPYASFGDVNVAVRRRIAEALAPAPAEGSAATRFGVDLLPTQLFGVVQAVPDVRAVPLLEVVVDGRPHSDISQPVRVDADQIAVLQEARVDVRPRTDL